MALIPVSGVLHVVMAARHLDHLKHRLRVPGQARRPQSGAAARRAPRHALGVLVRPGEQMFTRLPGLMDGIHTKEAMASPSSILFNSPVVTINSVAFAHLTTPYQRGNKHQKPASPLSWMGVCLSRIFGSRDLRGAQGRSGVGRLCSGSRALLPSDAKRADCTGPQPQSVECSHKACNALMLHVLPLNPASHPASSGALIVCPCA